MMNNPEWPDLNAEVEQLVRTESRSRRDNDGFIPIGANHWGFIFDQMREIIEFAQEGNVVEVGAFVMDNAAEDDPRVSQVEHPVERVEPTCGIFQCRGAKVGL
jgi:alpha-galactosidase